MEPCAVQERVLRGYLRANTQTAFGRAHGFGAIQSYEDFVRHVPLADYESVEPWITRIQQGEKKVLTHRTVTHLIPTSGSAGARKLIPFTTELQREFNAAIGPWLLDLQRQFPGILSGPAYWSITPACKRDFGGESTVPIGFDADTDYLGGARRRLAETVMAVPPGVQQANSMEAFRYETLLYLLRCRELRLISIWHPSFLSLLLEAMPARWERLLEDIAGAGPLRALPRRAKELRAIGFSETALLWPKLRVISCWGDGHAELGIVEIERRFPKVFIQRKGLLATEGIVTIPFSGRQPLALESHFFEFLDEGGEAHRAHELCRGEEYEIVLTTSGGLWRYRLRDKVRVTSFLGRTPSLQFLGRAGNVADRFGEKLSESFVSRVVQEATARTVPRSFALLAPDEGQFGCGYTLYLEGDIEPDLANRLDLLLRQNPHYAWCRDLGQLRAPRLFRIRSGGFETFAARQSRYGSRLGDIKPASLSNHSGWSQWFEGEYRSP